MILDSSISQCAYARQIFLVADEKTIWRFGGIGLFFLLHDPLLLQELYYFFHGSTLPLEIIMIGPLTIADGKMVCQEVIDLIHIDFLNVFNSFP